MLLLKVGDFIDRVRFMEHSLRRAYKAMRMQLRYLRLLRWQALKVFVRYLAGNTSPIQIQVRGVGMGLRPGSTDLATLQKIFGEQEYAIPIACAPQVIIDGGANVGYSSLYFAHRYPQAKIIAVEPHPENFLLLTDNVKLRSQIIPLQAAVWYDDVPIGLWDPEEGHWGFRVSEERTQGGELEIQGRSIDSIMRQHGVDRVDILKLDIEGSEKEVFEHADAWIDDIGIIVAELHDRYRMGCARAVYKATDGFAYEEKIGENILLARSEYVVQST
jgi:FkbM family methyltransferase